MNLTDDLIREALDLAATRAPDPRRIEAALAAGPERVRQRRLLLVAGAAAGASVVAAGTAGVFVAGRHYTGADPTASQPGPGPSTSPSPSTPPSLPTVAPTPVTDGTIRTPYRFASLPDGFTEAGREVSLTTGTWVRRWRKLDTILGFVTVGTDLAALTPDTMSPLTVGGAAGLVRVASDPGGRSVLVWPHAGRVLAVTTIGTGMNSVDMLLQLAGSLLDDPGAAVPVPVRFGWLPDPGLAAATATLLREMVAMSASVTAGREGTRLEVNVMLTIGGSVERPGGTRWPVRGVTGIGRIEQNGGYLYIPQSSTVTIEVTVTGGPATRDMLVRIGNGLVIDTTTPIAWTP